jgi:sugar lactone lactonase YvrE
MVVTPDNATLIVAESFAGRLTAFDIDDDGDVTLSSFGRYRIENGELNEGVTVQVSR